MTTTPFDLVDVLASAAMTSLRENVEYIIVFSFPTLLYGCFSSTTQTFRAFWSTAAIACIAILDALDESFLSDLFGVCAALTYYLGAAAAIFQLHKPVLRKRMGNDSLFCIALLAYVALPTLLFRSTGIVAALLVGWFMVLSSYSYCVDIARQRYPARFRDFLFFTFIDPALSLPERSHRATVRAGWRKVTERASRGLLLLTLGETFLSLFPSIAQATHLERSWGVYTATLIHGVSVFVAIYWLRSGLADVRIAMLEILGFSVPVAYDRPYLATSPKEFWARWNLYVGHWARRYVFGPVALHVARRANRGLLARLKVAHVVAVLATFLVIGALHDALNFAGQGITEFVYLRVFGLASLVLLSWEGLRLFGQRLQRATAMQIPPLVLALIGRFGLLHYVVMLMMVLRRI